MAINESRRRQLLEYLEESRKNALTLNLQYAPEQRAYLELSDMETVQRGPVGGFGYTCYVFRAKNRTRNCPVHINIHGGGFYYGHKDNDWFFSSYLADRIRGIVVDIDYTTTAANTAWPLAMEQCYDAAQWVFASCGEWDADARRVSMGGYSAGGTLTAAVAVRAAETGDFRLCLQVLGYGTYDSRTPPQYKMNGYLPHMMPIERMDAFSELLTNGDESVQTDPRLSPLYAPDELLARLPRALVCTAGLCDFRFEGERYALRMAAAGVEVTMRRFLGARHGFIPHFMEHWQEAAELIVASINDASL